MTSLTLHGTTVALKEKAVLILGKPGMGKSSLALQLIDRGAKLVADDQTCLTLEKDALYASCPAPLKGLMEVRGVGLCPFPSQDTVPLALVVELCEPQDLQRLPDPSFVQYHGIEVPSLKVASHDFLGAFKVEIKLNLPEAEEMHA